MTDNHTHTLTLTHEEYMAVKYAVTSGALDLPGVRPSEYIDEKYYLKAIETGRVLQGLSERLGWLGIDRLFATVEELDQVTAEEEAECQDTDTST